MTDFSDPARWATEEGDYGLLQVDEEYWGEGADQIVRDWIGLNYDPASMPTLQVAEIKGKTGLWLLGWDHFNTSWPSLMPLIFGDEYAAKQLSFIRDKGIRITALEHGEYGMGGHARA